VEEAQVVVGRREAVLGIKVGEIMEGRGHHGVCKGGKVGANMGRSGRRGGEGGKILGLEMVVDVAAEVREADGAISEVGKGRGLRAEKWEARREVPVVWNWQQGGGWL
jgi:hypothetical protein